MTRRDTDVKILIPAKYIPVTSDLIVSMITGIQGSADTPVDNVHEINQRVLAMFLASILTNDYVMAMLSRLETAKDPTRILERLRKQIIKSGDKELADMLEYAQREVAQDLIRALIIQLSELVQCSEIGNSITEIVDIDVDEEDYTIVVRVPKTRVLSVFGKAYADSIQHKK